MSTIEIGNNLFELLKLFLTATVPILFTEWRLRSNTHKSIEKLKIRLKFLEGQYLQHLDNQKESDDNGA